MAIRKPLKTWGINSGMIRPICSKCSQRPVSINYHRKGKTYFRSICGSCLKKSKKIRTPIPSWAINGYKKKLKCDKCGFSARWHCQIAVFYVDGNMNNNKFTNLKSICMNCAACITKEGMPWKRSIIPDN